MGAPSKRAKKIRTAAEFDVARLRAQLSMPKEGRIPLTSWTLEQIKSARDAQLRGDFRQPARMVEAMRTDEALSVPYENRLAPQRCLPVELVPAKGARGAAIAEEGRALYGNGGVGLRAETLADVNGCLVEHGIAIGANAVNVREDGSRIDLEMRYWPIEFVRWDPVARVLKTRVDPSSLASGDIPSDPALLPSGFEVPIIHGDGRWVIFQKHEDRSWTKEAAVLSASFVWARHAYAIRDWAKGSLVHGGAKLIGAMPEGMPLQGKDGKLTPEAEAFIGLMKSLMTEDLPIGIKPAGSSLDFIFSAAQAWQVWKELVLNAEQAGARIYLGTDGMLGSKGGAPGVDIGALFGVGATRVESDLRCMDRAILTGVIEPWCAMNFGDSTLAPRRRYMLPDPDAAARQAALAAREAAFFAAIRATKDLGFECGQEYVNALAERHGVQPPLLPPETAKGPSIALAPTDIARVVSVNEARASAGLAPLLGPDGAPDPDGRLTVEEYAAKKKGLVPPAGTAA